MNYIAEGVGLTFCDFGGFNFCAFDNCLYEQADLNNVYNHTFHATNVRE